MGQYPSTARSENIVESATSILMQVSQTASIENQTTTVVSQNVIIRNVVEGDVSVVIGGTNTVTVNTEVLQSSYFDGNFDTEINNSIAQVSEAIASSVGPLQSGASSESSNITRLLTELAYEINLAYFTECTTTTIVEQSVIVEDVLKGDVSVTFEGNTFIDTTSMCSQSTSSVIAIKNSLTTAIDQVSKAETTSSIWATIIACTLIIIVCALIIFVSFSNLFKLMLFVVSFALVGIGIWALSAWLLNTPPFAPEPLPPDPTIKTPDPNDPEDIPEQREDFTLLYPGQKKTIIMNDGNPYSETVGVTLCSTIFNDRMPSCPFTVRILTLPSDAPAGSNYVEKYKRELMATKTERSINLFVGEFFANYYWKVEIINQDEDYLFVSDVYNKFVISAGLTAPLATNVRQAQGPSFEIRAVGNSQEFEVYYDDGLGYVYKYQEEKGAPTYQDFATSSRSLFVPRAFDFDKAFAIASKDSNYIKSEDHKDEKTVTSYRIMIKNISKSGGSLEIFGV